MEVATSSSGMVMNSKGLFQPLQEDTAPPSIPVRCLQWGNQSMEDKSRSAKVQNYLIPIRTTFENFRSVQKDSQNCRGVIIVSIIEREE